MTKTFQFSSVFPVFDITVTTEDTATSVNAGGSTYQAYTVTSVGGTYNRSQIEGIVGNGGSEQADANGYKFDNAIFVNDSQGAGGSVYGLDNEGVEFEIAGGDAYRIYSSQGKIFLRNPQGELITPDTVSVAVCFVSGTLIKVNRDGIIDNVPVETLSIGDLAMTATGTARPITWLGHRMIDCARHPAPKHILPIRITANAFGENRPTRDLRVSPGHAICVDVAGEVFIPAHALVNGTTIFQETVNEVTYWHVELENHDVLFAEDLPCESYIEMGNRGFFAEADTIVLHARPDEPIFSHDSFCRPFVCQGPLLEAARVRLARMSKFRTANRVGVDSDPPQDHRDCDPAGVAC